jgi:hypothetical protein
MNKSTLLKWIKKIRYRHWMGVLAVIILYVIWKAYVLQTPSTSDDNIPDKIKDAVLIMVYDDDGDSI